MIVFSALAWVLGCSNPIEMGCDTGAGQTVAGIGLLLVLVSIVTMPLALATILVGAVIFLIDKLRRR